MFSKLSLNTHRVGQFSLYLLAAYFSSSVKYPLIFSTVYCGIPCGVSSLVSFAILFIQS